MMNWIDFWVVLSIVVLVLAIVFFRYVYPRLKYRSGNKIVQQYRHRYGRNRGCRRKCRHGRRHDMKK
ncbi:MAG: hypothetical protein LKK13_01685 [Bacilli bacterium]|jgi:hypothetical protein|nr:hypothetical protein [Bacilli bacterium]